MGEFDLYNSFVNLIKSGVVKCRICGTTLEESEIRSHDSKYGIMKPESDNPQWVYVHCTKCEYDWSYTKILLRGVREK